MTRRWRRPAAGGGHALAAGGPPFALPPDLERAALGVLVLRPGPAGPDITDVNGAAADILGRCQVGLLGTLVEDCPRLRHVAGLPEAVERVSHGVASRWHATDAGSSVPTLTLTLSAGPVGGVGAAPADPGVRAVSSATAHLILHSVTRGVIPLRTRPLPRRGAGSVRSSLRAPGTRS